MISDVMFETLTWEMFTVAAVTFNGYFKLVAMTQFDRSQDSLLVFASDYRVDQKQDFAFSPNV